MKTSTAVVSAILVGTLATGTAVYASSQKADRHGTITRVIDGDTVDMNIAGNETRVRLLNIDTPETVDPNKPVECLGPEASDNLKSLLKPGDEVELKYDVERIDPYGRTLAAVFKGDKFINRSIAEAGLGIAVKYEPNTKYYQEILNAQKAAESKNTGLFSADVSCTIPSQLNDATDQLAQAPTDTAQTAQEAAEAAGQAGTVAAAGLAASKALDALTPETHPVSAALLATTFKTSADKLRERTKEVQNLKAQHERREETLATQEKEEKKKAAEAKAKKEAEEKAKREAIQKAAAARKAEQRAVEQRAAEQRAAEQEAARRNALARQKSVAPKTAAPKYVAPKKTAPKAQTPPKTSVPKNYTGPRCYAPGGKSWKPCG